MHTRVIDSSATCLRLGALAFAIALTLRGGIASAQETDRPEGVEADRRHGRSAAHHSERRERLLVRLQQVVARYAALRFVRQRGADLAARHLGGRRPRAHRARHVHESALGTARRHRRAQHAGRHVLPRNEAAQHARPRTHVARRHGCDRSRQRPAVADLRHGPHRRLHESAAEARPLRRRQRSCPRRRASRSRSSARGTAPRRRSASAARSSIGREARRVLRLRPARGLRHVRRARARRAEDRASGRQHRQCDRQFPARSRHAAAELEHGRRVHDARDAGPHRQRHVHSRRAAREPRHQRRRSGRLPRDASRLAGARPPDLRQRAARPGLPLARRSGNGSAVRGRLVSRRPRHSADAVRLSRRAVRRRHGHVGELPRSDGLAARARRRRPRADLGPASRRLRARSAHGRRQPTSTIGARPTRRSRTRISASSSSTSSTTSTRTSRSRISSSTTVSTASRTRSCRTARTKINGSWRTSSPITRRIPGGEPAAVARDQHARLAELSRSRRRRSGARAATGTSATTSWPAKAR